MNFTRPRAWDWVTALCATVLLVSLVLPWYRYQGSGTTAFEAAGFTACVLGLLALLGIALPPVTAARATPAVPLAVNVLAVAFAVPAIIFILVAVATIDLPVGTVPIDGPAAGPGSDQPAASGRAAGIWVALGATLATFYAAYRALRDERAPGVLSAPDPVAMPAPAASLAADAQP